MNISLYDPAKTASTKYLFFTGKGGVGKTSIACATAVALADAGEKILLVSTDPASNLQDVFGVSLNDAGVAIAEVPGLVVANLDPLTAAAEYRESVIGAYRGKLPDSAIQNVEEQLSGSCTVEIAAFNAFSEFLTNAEKAEKFDHIIFDTAPTGHTLRMLQLPSAWSGFISESKHGASCLGQLSGLEDKKEMYKKAVHTLADSRLTTLILVTRPETAPIREAQRASHELEALEIRNQVLVINGLLETYDVNDAVETALFKRLCHNKQLINSHFYRGVSELPYKLLFAVIYTHLEFRYEMSHTITSHHAHHSHQIRIPDGTLLDYMVQYRKPLSPQFFLCPKKFLSENNPPHKEFHLRPYIQNNANQQFCFSHLPIQYGSMLYIPS